MYVLGLTLALGVIAFIGLVNGKESLRLAAAAVFVAACFLPARALFAQDPVVLTEDRGEYPLGLHLEHLEDKTRNLTIDDVRSKAMEERWARSNREILNFSYTLSSHWIRVNVAVRNFGGESYVLEINYPNISEADLFVIENNAMVLQAKSWHYFQLQTSPPH